MQIALFGLGKMGAQIARRLHKNNFEVLVWNRSEGPRKEFDLFTSLPATHDHGMRIGSRSFAEIADVIDAMAPGQRVFWLMLPHTIVDDFLQNQLGPKLSPGDIVIDGGNSFYKDSIRRAEQLREKEVLFYDCGTSGGVWGEENGFALMVGGPQTEWSVVEPIFKTLSSGSNFGLVGHNGAGHFVKMVHNGIEYGMMEAIAEGYAVLNASPFDLHLSQVAQIYQEGSVVRSWLIDLTKNIFDDEDVAGTSGVIAATGEGEWTVNAGKEFGVDVRVIEESLKVRQESQDPANAQKFSNKIVALLRKQFGGHGILKK